MLTLTRDELSELTGYARRTEQARVLAEQGIPFKDVGGRLVVLQCHVLAWMENRPVRAAAEPDWSAIR